MKRVCLGVVLIGGMMGVPLGSACGQGAADPFRRTAPSPAGLGGGVISSVEFVNTPVTTLFKMISDLTGWSIVLSPEVSRDPPKINIWVKNLTAEQVLQQVAVLGELMVERKDRTVTVMRFSEYARIHGAEIRVVPLKHGLAREVVKVL
ncbi:MAG TPA: hypothetical protein VM389_11085, partial [Phycisphaerae bacterium]|nr:hypothetical protein [Phycisphaerae bacterium]